MRGFKEEDVKLCKVRFEIVTFSAAFISIRVYFNVNYW
jgi:hypothetical protein